MLGLILKLGLVLRSELGLGVMIINSNDAGTLNVTFGSLS